MRGAGRPVRIANLRPGLRIDRQGVEAAVQLLDASAARFLGGCPPGELSLAFLTDTALARLHGRFLGDPSATDVITFGADAAHGLAGEVCVSVDAAARQAGRRDARLARELTLYVVHGWLHLAGYDDTNPPARRSMRRAEARAMEILRRKRALPRFKLA